MADKPKFVLCMRTIGNLKPPVKGAQRRACSECGKGVWVAPESQQIVNKLKIPLVCIPCKNRLFPDTQVIITTETIRLVKEYNERN
jgi:hypothetical protein